MDNHVQVLLYTSYLHIIGGIETFIINFLDIMSPYYDIGVCCPELPQDMEIRISQRVPLYRNADGLSCDTLIMIRIDNNIPKCIKYNQAIRMVHCCKANFPWIIKKDSDKIVHVSEASKKSFSSDGDVILNPLIRNTKKSLMLVSATRIPAIDKGKNAERMLKLAKMLNDADIPFLWFNFSDAPLQNAPRGFMNIGAFQDIQPYIAKADYLVQLSDQEGFGYSVLEALINNTAVICTPFDTTTELGVEDGVNGYIVPFNMQFDVNKLLDVPKFEYEYSNEKIVNAWRKLLGDARPQHKYIPDKIVTVKAITKYDDVILKKTIQEGEKLRVFERRAKTLIDAEVCELDKGDENGKI